MTYELWNMDSKNMVFNWTSSSRAELSLREVVARKDVSVLKGHALLAVDDDENSTLIGENEAILEVLAVLKLIEEVQGAVDTLRVPLDELVAPIIEQYRKSFGLSDQNVEPWIRGFLSARLLSGTFDVDGSTLHVGELPELNLRQLPELKKAG